jgi:hypothetical protein
MIEAAVPTLEIDGARSEALLVLDSSGRLSLLNDAYELRALLAVREVALGDWRWLPDGEAVNDLTDDLPGHPSQTVREMGDRIHALLAARGRLLVSGGRFVKAGPTPQPEALRSAFEAARPSVMLSSSGLTVHQRPSESTVFFLNDLSFAMGSIPLRVRLGQARGDVVFFLEHPHFYVGLHDMRGNWKLTVEFTCPLPPVLPRPDWTGRIYSSGRPSEMAWRGCAFSTTPAFLPFARPPYAISPRAWSLALGSRYKVYSLLTDLHAACLSSMAARGDR